MSDKIEKKDSSNSDDRKKYVNNNRQGNQSNAVRNNRKVYLKRKYCRFCSDKSLVLDYKNVDLISKFTTEGGKIIPKRINGNCAKHQRELSNAVKLARAIALLPYVKKPKK